MIIKITINNKNKNYVKYKIKEYEVKKYES